MTSQWVSIVCHQTRRKRPLSDRERERGTVNKPPFVLLGPRSPKWQHELLFVMHIHSLSPVNAFHNFPVPNNNTKNEKTTMARKTLYCFDCNWYLANVASVAAWAFVCSHKVFLADSSAWYNNRQCPIKTKKRGNTPPKGPLGPLFQPSQRNAFSLAGAGGGHKTLDASVNKKVSRKLHLGSCHNKCDGGGYNKQFIMQLIFFLGWQVDLSNFVSGYGWHWRKLFQTACHKIEKAENDAMF